MFLLKSLQNQIFRPLKKVKENIPLIVTLQSIKDNERKKEYTEKRDQWNVDREGEVRNI